MAKSRQPSSDDLGTRRGIAAAIAEARKAIGNGKPIAPTTRIGDLGDTQWGWIIAGGLFGWISARAEQATREGWDHEAVIRTLGTKRDPWERGAIAAILPKLADSLKLNWEQPVGKWPKTAMVEFLAAALALVRRAEIARDVSEAVVAGGELRADVVARRANAAVGNPLMTPDELGDDSDSVPF
jgi:hypothetical protein